MTLTSDTARWGARGSRLIRQVAAGMVLSCMFLAPAAAQNIANSFAGFSSQKDQPVKIEADRLEVFDNRKKATFTGNVKVTQGKLTMRSKRLEVTYQQKNGGRKPKPKKAVQKASQNAAVKSIRASDRVVIDTPDRQSVTSNWAEFDVNRQLITIGGNVVMSQGNNVLKGDKLVINLADGTSRLDTRRIGGHVNDKKQRVRMILTPGNIGKIPSFTGSRKGDAGGKKGAATKSDNKVDQSMPWVRRNLEAERQKKFGDALGE